MSKLIKKLNEVQRELEERQNLCQTNHADFESVVTYGPDNLKGNPLDAIENDKLFDDIENKIALLKGRINDKNEDLKDL